MNIVGFIFALFAVVFVCAHAFILQELPLDRSERTLRTVGNMHNRKLFRTVRAFGGYPRFSSFKRSEFYDDLPEYSRTR